MLSPRGWGRTLFSLCETIRLGNIPIYIWDDIPWIPYKSIWYKYAKDYQYLHNEYNKNKLEFIIFGS